MDPGENARIETHEKSVKMKLHSFLTRRKVTVRAWRLVPLFWSFWTSTII